jgi:cell shape-determining protein MreC
MNYQEISSGRKRARPLLSKGLLIAFILCLILFGQAALRGLLGPSVTEFIRPIAAVLGSITPQSNTVVSKTSLEAENKALRTKLERLDSAFTGYQTLEEENRKLKSFLGRHASSTVLLASVITRPPVSPYDTLIVDAGSNLQVQPGARVWNESAVLIGMIDSVSKYSARVRLYSTPGHKLQVLLGASSTPIEIEGQGGGMLKGSLPSVVTLATGTPAYLPGIKKELVGIIKGIIKDDVRTFQSIYLQNITDTNNLDFIVIEKNPERDEDQVEHSTTESIKKASDKKTTSTKSTN